MSVSTRGTGSPVPKAGISARLTTGALVWSLRGRRSIIAGIVKSTVAPEWFRMCSIWRGRSVSFTVTAIAPVARAPKNDAAAPAPLGRKIATRSSGRTP
jgi:hypothetical protein